MEYMLIMLWDKEDPKEDPSVFPEMGKFAGGLASQGKLKGGAPLQPEAEGARVRIREGRTVTTDGPFSETKEVIGGYFIVECESRDEAVAIAERCPHARVGLVEVREVMKVG